MILWSTEHLWFPLVIILIPVTAFANICSYIKRPFVVIRSNIILNIIISQTDYSSVVFLSSLYFKNWICEKLFLLLQREKQNQLPDLDWGFENILKSNHCINLKIKMYFYCNASHVKNKSSNEITLAQQKILHNFLVVLAEVGHINFPTMGMWMWRNSEIKMCNEIQFSQPLGSGYFAQWICKIVSFLQVGKMYTFGRYYHCLFCYLPQGIHH